MKYPDIKKKLIQFQGLINRRLDFVLRNKIKEFGKLAPITGRMTEEIKKFVLADGKRLRPIFVYYGYLASGGKNKKAILDASIFAELVHDYFLIHDDVIDQDELRRGRPSFHSRYQAVYKNQKRAEHIGNCAAILAGDLISVLAYEALADSKFSTVLKNKAIKEFNQYIKDVILGQTMDVFLGLGKYLNEKEILKIHRLKTSRYTIDGPMRIGAILAGANSIMLKIISQYAIPLGIAFQIQDDILGMFGNTKETGKPSGADLREGKQTLLILKTRELADVKQRKIITRALGNNHLNKKQLAEVRKIIIETGSLKYSNDLVVKLINYAKLAIKNKEFPPEVKEFMVGIADYIIKRKK